MPKELEKKLGQEAKKKRYSKERADRFLKYRITFKGFISIYEEGLTIYDAIELYLRRTTPAGEVGAIILDPNTGILDFSSVERRN